MGGIDEVIVFAAIVRAHIFGYDEGDMCPGESLASKLCAIAAASHAVHWHEFCRGSRMSDPRDPAWLAEYNREHPTMIWQILVFLLKGLILHRRGAPHW